MKCTLCILSSLLLTVALHAADDENATQSKSSALAELFETLDTNKDDHLTLDDFKAITKRPEKTAMMEEAFKQADKDNDGKLSLQGLKEFPVEGLLKKSMLERKPQSGLFNNFLRRLPIVTITEKVDVTLTEGKMTLDTKTVPVCNRVVFQVKNTGEEPHHFVVAVTGFPPDKMPVQNGRVRYYSISGDSHRIEFRDRGGWSQQSSREQETYMGSNRIEPGVKLAAGEEVEFKETYIYDPRFKSGTSFVLFCNEHGHYERGEFAQVVVK